jgi:hypothetical protein
MNSVFDDYSCDKDEKYLYIFPIERLKIKNKEKIGDVTIKILADMATWGSAISAYGLTHKAVGLLSAAVKLG